MTRGERLFFTGRPASERNANDLGFKNSSWPPVKYKTIAINLIVIATLLFSGGVGSAHAQVAPNRLIAKALGLVINTADPYSVAVGNYYAQRRGIAAEHILRVVLPVKSECCGV